MTPDFYPKPTQEQVEHHMNELRAVLQEARERFEEWRRQNFQKAKGSA